MQERIIDKVMEKEFFFGGVRLKIVDMAFIACLFLFAFFLRWQLMPIESADYFGFLEDWMRTIRENGGYRSLSMEISNYTPPYMYIMTLLTYVSTNDLYALKLVSVLFDYLAAVAVFLILYQMTGKKRKAILGMAVLLLLPAVILDGAYWCQCDIIYTTFLLYSFYFFLKDNSRKTMIFFGIAFAFKLQAVFFLPFYLMMWMKKKTVFLRHFLWVPVVYLVSILPAFLMGRDLRELLTVYWNQSGYYPWGTLEYPNAYALLGEVMPDLYHAKEVSGAGIFMTLALLCCLAYYFYTMEVRLTQDMMVTLALFSVALIVYTLPHMHDRYGFLVDLLAVVYGVSRAERFPIVCGFSLVSVLSFMPYLIAVHLIPIQYVAIGLLGLILLVGRDLYRQVQTNRIAKPAGGLQNQNPVL